MLIGFMVVIHLVLFYWQYFGGPWYAFTVTAISEVSASSTLVEIVRILLLQWPSQLWQLSEPCMAVEYFGGPWYAFNATVGCLGGPAHGPNLVEIRSSGSTAKCRVRGIHGRDASWGPASLHAPRACREDEVCY